MLTRSLKKLVLCSSKIFSHRYVTCLLAQVRANIRKPRFCIQNRPCLRLQKPSCMEQQPAVQEGVCSFIIGPRRQSQKVLKPTTRNIHVTLENPHFFYTVFPTARRSISYDSPTASYYYLRSQLQAAGRLVSGKVEHTRSRTKCCAVAFQRPQISEPSTSSFCGPPLASSGYVLCLRRSATFSAAPSTSTVHGCGCPVGGTPVLRL